MEKITSFDLDFKADQDTAEIAVGSFFLKIKQAGNSNKKYSSRMMAYQAKYGRKIKNKQVSDDEISKALAKIITETLIVDWREVKTKDEKGNWVDLPFNAEDCVDMLTRYPDVQATILEEAREIDNFKREECEEVAKK